MQRPSKSEKSPEEEGFEDVSGGEVKGLWKKVLKEGEGPLCPAGMEAIVHYTGKLTNGVVFDSSRKRRVPFTFPVGERRVILGWDKGVQTMKKGEVSILKLAPEYGYGSSNVGPIPPNSTLIFEIELIGWKAKTPDIFGFSIERIGQFLGVLVCLVVAWKYFM